MNALRQWWRDWTRRRLNRRWQRKMRCRVDTLVRIRESQGRMEEEMEYRYEHYRPCKVCGGLLCRWARFQCPGDQSAV